MANPTHQYGALSNVLQDYLDATKDVHYEQLFQSDTGYLKCEGKNRKTWAITYAQPDDMVAALEVVREGLVGMKVSDIPNALELIQRVNTVYCQSLYGASVMPGNGIIGFNSRSRDISKVFSNFFSTLLIFKDQSGEEVIFPSSEVAYQLHKIVLESADSSISVSTGSAPDSFSKTESKTSALTADSLTMELNPFKAKKLADLQRRKGLVLTDELAVAKYALMKDVVQAKLKANPFLTKKLVESGDAFLVEDTGNPSFWGGVPEDQSLRHQKLPITKRSQNVLGRILMDERADMIRDC